MPHDRKHGGFGDTRFGHFRGRCVSQFVESALNLGGLSETAPRGLEKLVLVQFDNQKISADRRETEPWKHPTSRQTYAEIELKDGILTLTISGLPPQKFTPTIDDDGKCKFRIIPNDAADKSTKANLLCVWQISRRALEPLMFL